ncbi:unnamed protein product, partial [Rhizoctonia solani]
IHDAIRAINTISTVPALHDAKLSAQLAQHLFTVQMAVYLNEYPPCDLPRVNMYMPPPIPSYIPISLEPVVAAPSDKELEVAHNAVRTLEGLAHVWQKAARYIQDSNQGRFVQRPINPPPPPQANDNDPPASTPDHPPNMTDQQGSQDTPPTGPDPNGPTPQTAPPSHEISELISVLRSQVSSDQFCAALQNTNQLLSGNRELLTDIGRTLASTRILTFPPHSYHSYRRANCEGEIPWMHNLPYVSSGDGSTLVQEISEQDLVAYLRFYKIDSGLVEGYGAGSLRPGQEEQARKKLAYYIYYGRSV